MLGSKKLSRAYSSWKLFWILVLVSKSLWKIRYVWSNMRHSLVTLHLSLQFSSSIRDLSIVYKLIPPLTTRPTSQWTIKKALFNSTYESNVSDILYFSLVYTTCLVCPLLMPIEILFCHAWDKLEFITWEAWIRSYSKRYSTLAIYL